MISNDTEKQLAEAQRRIVELEEELAETNRGLMALTVELEQRVEQRTEALRARKADLKEAQRLAHIGSWRWDAKTKVTISTDELLRIFGFDPATETMPDFEQQRGRCYPPQDWERVRAAMQRTLGTGAGYELDVRAIRNGETIWLTTRGEAVRDAHDRIVGLRGTVADITSRKRTEEALQRQSEVLLGINRVLELALGRLTEEQLCEACLEVVESLTASRISFIGEIGPDGFLHDLAISNPGWDACKMNDQSGHRRPPGDFPIHGIYGRVLADGTSLIVNDPAAHPDRIGLPEGHPPLTAFLGVSLFREDKVVGMIAVGNREDGYRIEDQEALEAIAPAIVEALDRKRAQKSLRELNATLEGRVAERTAELARRANQLQKLALELSQAEDRERRRIAVILHDDLQQQIAAAKFHVGLIGSRARHDPSLQKAVARVDEMLMEAVEKSRRLSHELSPAILQHGTLGEALRWLASQMQAKHGLAVRVDGDSRVNLDSDALRTFLFRAAQELLFNVVKHSGTDRARVHLRRLGRCLCLSVSDRGSGFDPQALEATKGFGLLSIRERIELLGGRMTIRSHVGRGSTFFIASPDRQFVAGAIERESLGRQQPVQRADRAARDEDTGQSRLRVLLADDHEIMRQGLVALFAEQRDIEVVGEASNGRDAVDQAYRLQPDVVVMDVAMPLMSGDEAATQIKRHLPETRIVALSMFHENDVAERMRRAGAEAYVLKTAPSETLLTAIRGEPARTKAPATRP
ncbi:MAG: response regulator [Phycisphaerales bacterium]